MSAIKFSWNGASPPLPDVYTTRRNESKYLTLRYWDGESWFEVAGGSRGGQPFKWPAASRTRCPKYLKCSGALRLRKIGSNLGAIQWGDPFKVFDEKETLAYLVTQGVLPPGWRTDYQDCMRDVFPRPKG